MKQISIPGFMQIESLQFKTDVLPESFDKQVTVHVFDLLRFSECKVTWNPEINDGEFHYPSEDWLAEKLQEVLNGRS